MFVCLSVELYRCEVEIKLRAELNVGVVLLPISTRVLMMAEHSWVNVNMLTGCWDLI